jgi:hypothetical protein
MQWKERIKESRDKLGNLFLSLFGPLSECDYRLGFALYISSDQFWLVEPDVISGESDHRM